MEEKCSRQASISTNIFAVRKLRNSIHSPQLMLIKHLSIPKTNQHKYTERKFGSFSLIFQKSK